MMRLIFYKHIRRTLTTIGLLGSFVLSTFSQTPAPLSPAFTRDPNTGLLSGDVNAVYQHLKTVSSTLPLQVFLEVNIFEVMIRDDDDIGFIYDILGEVGSLSGTSLSGEPNIESDLSVLGSSLGKALLPAGANVVASIFEGDEGEVQTVIQALAEDQIIKVHANPILLTVQGIPARLETGEDIPFLERASLGNVETVVSNYRKTGVILQVTPWVGYLETDVQMENPFIRVEIQADLSTVSRYREEEGFTQPIVDNRKYQTNVWLKAGSRIIIGSLFRDSLATVGRGIPILKDITLLGRLFRSSSTSSNVSQLYVIIRPVLFNLENQDSILQEREFRSSSDNLQNILDERSQEVDVDANPLDEFQNRLKE